MRTLFNHLKAVSILGAQHAKNTRISTYAFRIDYRPGMRTEPSRRYEFRVCGINVCSADDGGHGAHGRRYDDRKADGQSGSRFRSDEIPHHQGAIDMAKLELIYGRDPVLRRLAQGIIVEQQQEIEVMQRYLHEASAAQ